MLAQRPGRDARERSPLLVIADPLDADREAACSTLLDGADVSPSVLVFAYNRRPRVVAEHVHEHAESDFESLTILDLCESDHRRSQSATLGQEVVVERESASNLTGIGIDVADAIDRVEEEPLHVCLGSLTTLVQYVDPETAFKFLQVTISRLESCEGHVHAHLDPDAVDEATATTLQSLFDGALRRRGHEWTIEE